MWGVGGKVRKKLGLLLHCDRCRGTKPLTPLRPSPPPIPPLLICTFEKEKPVWGYKLDTSKSVCQKHRRQTFSNTPDPLLRWGVCPFWHAGILDMPGVFCCWAPVKGKWLCFILWQLAKDFDLFMFQVGHRKLWSQYAGPGTESVGWGWGEPQTLPALHRIRIVLDTW